MAALSLWLLPAEPLGQRLRALMAELARRLGTPVFAPHVTLLSDVGGDEVDVTARAGQLAAALPPVPLTFSRAAHQGQYYRCVFLEAEPAAELLGAHQRARRLLGGGGDRFRPHLSLVYGRLAGPERERLVREMEAALAPPVATVAGRLEVHRTMGAPRRWRRCATFALG